MPRKYVNRVILVTAIIINPYSKSIDLKYMIRLRYECRNM